MARNHKNWLESYMKYSSFSEAPDKFHFWTGISMLAGAIRRRVFIHQGYFEWVPNFYIVFVAPPGIVSKSTTANIGVRLLKEVPNVKFGPNVVTWQALVKAFSEATEVIERADGTLDPMSAMTIVASELGNLLNPQDREMVDMLVNLWDCHRGEITKVTKTMGDDRIQNPWVNMIGCTTPDWISGTFPEYMIGGGFTSRCIFVYGEDKRKLVAYPGLVMDQETRDMAGPLSEDLVHISNLEGEFKLTSEAVAWGEAWYTDHYDKNKHSISDSRMKGYLARKQTHMHKLAMILSLSQKDELVITEENLQLACTVLTAAEADMPKVFAHIGLTNETRAIEFLINLVRRVTKIDYEEAYRALSRSLTSTQFEEVAKSAIKTGYIRHDTVNGRTILSRVLDSSQDQPVAQPLVAAPGP